MRCMPHGPPSRQARLTFRHNPPPTIRGTSLTSLATNLCNSTLVLAGMILILSSTLVLARMVPILSSIFVL
jgi:hypothetical protein